MSRADPTLRADVLDDVRSLLRDALGPAVRVEVEHLPRWEVAVLRLHGGGAAGDRVVLRLGPSRTDGGRPGFSESARRSIFHNEWAAAHFLAGVPEVSDVVPGLLAGDLDGELLLTEHVGDGTSLADVLLGDDAAAARHGLELHAAAVGRVAAATAPRTTEYLDLRARCGPVDPATSVVDRPYRDLVDLLRRDGVGVPSELVAELEVAETLLRHPGAWGAFSPSDTCPDNNALGTEGLRLFDFGFAHVAHVGLDAAFWAMPFPSCWCFAPLPTGLGSHLVEVYRSHVARAVPAALDDDAWAHAVSWGLTTWFSTWVVVVLERERGREQRRGPLPARDAVVAQLDAIATGTAEHHPASSAAAADLAADARARWGVRDVPTYPALRGGT